MSVCLFCTNANSSQDILPGTMKLWKNNPPSPADVMGYLKFNISKYKWGFRGKNCYPAQIPFFYDESRKEKHLTMLCNPIQLN